MSIKPAIKPGDWVRLGHDRHPDFRIEGIVQESFSGYLAVGETPFGLVGGELFYGYTILEHKPAEPVWAKDRVVADKHGDLFVRDGVKWHLVLGEGIHQIAYTTAEIAAAVGPITRIDPRSQS